MRKFVCAALTAGCFISAVAFGGCAVGEADVLYTLSEDGTHYIVSGVGGDKRGLVTCEVPASYTSEEGGELLPVTEIGEKAFMDCTRLNVVTLPDTIRKIGANAFTFCTFSEFTIPESVTFIGYGAFGRCKSLKEITIPKSVETIEPLAFTNCPSLQRAVIRANVTVLHYDTFFNSAKVQGSNIFSSSSLKEIYLPASLNKIHFQAFYGNIFMSDIYFGGSKEQWNELYFFEAVKSEENAEETVEKKYEKNEVLSNSITIHYNVEF